VSETGPASTAFWRVFLALPILYAWTRIDQHRSTDTVTRGNLRLMLLAGFFFAGDLAVWHWSIVLTSVANATLLANCAPIFVTLAAWLMFRRRPRALFIAGLALAMLGMALLLRGDFTHGERALLGDALGIITAMFYAAYQLTVTRARQHASTSSIMAVSGTITALILLPLALASGERFVPLTAHGWLLLVGLALIAQAAGQSLIAYAMAHLSATFSSVGLLLQPVIAAALAWMLLGEVLASLSIAGAMLVLLGIRIAHSADRES
jgi:drug/metabolite transporter (DMT)-like permease